MGPMATGRVDGQTAPLLRVCSNRPRTKFDPVRRVLLSLIPCKTNVHTPESGADS